MKRNASYRDIQGPNGLLSGLMEFEGHSMSTIWVGDISYWIYSYSTSIGIYVPLHDRTLYYNEFSYSNTTARHQSLLRSWLPYEDMVVCKDNKQIREIYRTMTKELA